MLDIREEGCPRVVTIPSQNIIMLPKNNGTCLFSTEPPPPNYVLNASTPGVINLCENKNLGVIGYVYHHGITESITSDGKETVDSYTLSYLSIPAILIIVVFALKYQKCCKKCKLKKGKDIKQSKLQQVNIEASINKRVRTNDVSLCDLVILSNINKPSISKNTVA